MQAPFGWVWNYDVRDYRRLALEAGTRRPKSKAQVFLNFASFVVLQQVRAGVAVYLGRQKHLSPGSARHIRCSTLFRCSV